MNDDDEAILMLDCMEAQVDEETKLIKELELMTACALNEELSDDIITPAISDDQGINLNIPDPKSQSEINRMDPKDALRFNNATISEVNGMKGKNVFVYATLDDLPQGTIPSKMNTAGMATKIFPAATVSVFSKIVLGLQDPLLSTTDYDD
jgi:hypothetical protein